MVAPAARRFLLILQYEGTRYCGWQNQRETNTVQAIIEQALKPLNHDQVVTLVAAGRTDAGVHAQGQVAHCDLVTTLTAAAVRRALNATLPEDIRVLECRPVAAAFHARFAAIQRTYKYLLSRQPTVFGRQYVWTPPFAFDDAVLKDAAALIIGEHDFSRLCRASTAPPNRLCRVAESFWTITDDLLIYTISANRFLHHMVRMLVGCMLEVARGKYALADFKNLLGKKAGGMQVYTAPSKGLFLWHVNYTEERT